MLDKEKEIGDAEAWFQPERLCLPNRDFTQFCHSPDHLAPCTCYEQVQERLGPGNSGSGVGGTTPWQGLISSAHLLPCI